MIIYKCDLCKKELDDAGRSVIDINLSKAERRKEDPRYYNRINETLYKEVCLDCFLKNSDKIHKIITL
ncbi:MAG: hypothetical protein R3321_07085 [Nitrososphaeraceae archaeon]|nr:hypothetical protein [Nitrososphaeraceae archaeon]